MLSFKFREFIKDEWVRSSLDNLYAQLRAIFANSFDDNGNLIVATPTGVVPVGAMLSWGAATAPDKWLICDGSQVSRVTYKSLYEIIGTTYGAGDGSTTFTLPDLRQRLPLGKAASGTGAALGDTGGAIDHTHAETIAAHTHTFSATSSTDGSHNHGGATSSDGAHSHPVPVTDAANTIYSQEVAAGTDFFVSTQDHFHSVGNTGSVGDHSHTIAADGNHSHTVSGTTASGGGAAGTTGSANPPFLVVNFIIYAGVATS